MFKKTLYIALLFCVHTTVGMHLVAKYATAFLPSWIGMHALYHFEPESVIEQHKTTFEHLYNEDVVEKASIEVQNQINVIVPNTQVYLFSSRKYTNLCDRLKDNIGSFVGLMSIKPGSYAVRNPFSKKNALMLEKEQFNHPQGMFVKEHEINHFLHKDAEWQLALTLCAPFITCAFELGLYTYGFTKLPVTFGKNIGIGLMHLMAAGVANHVLQVYQESQADLVWTKEAVEGGIQSLSTMQEKPMLAQFLDTHASNKKRIERLMVHKQKLESISKA